MNDRKGMDFSRWREERSGGMKDKGNGLTSSECRSQDSSGQLRDCNFSWNQGSVSSEVSIKGGAGKEEESVKQSSVVSIPSKDVEEIERGGAFMEERTSRSKTDPDDDIDNDLVLTETKSNDVDLSDDELNECSLVGDSSSKYEVLSPYEILQTMTLEIETTNNVLELAPTLTRGLLNHFCWEKDKLCESFYERETPEHLFKKARLENPLMSQSGGTSSSHLENAGGGEECPNCFDFIPSSDMFGMTCGHRFCTGCWTQYLTNRIAEERMGHWITCIGYECDVIVDDAIVMKFINEFLWLKYQEQMSNSFVELNRCIKWCPSPNCMYAVRVELPVNDYDRSVTCKCGHAFCFSCDAPAHHPISCEMLNQWNILQAKNSDLMSYQWVSENTKNCPKCKVHIQKNGGCQFMNCWKCRHQFCWNCLKDDFGHGHGDVCNRTERSEQTTVVVPRDRGSFENPHVRFYIELFNSIHWEVISGKKLDELVKKTRDDLHDQKIMSLGKSQFLKMAVDTVGRCRQTLMYTCVLIYFLSVDKSSESNRNQVEIFKENHTDLLFQVGKLRTLCENTVNEISSPLDLGKFEIKKLFQYCEIRRKKLLEHVQEGYGKEWWKIH